MRKLLMVALVAEFVGLFVLANYSFCRIEGDDQFRALKHKRICATEKHGDNAKLQKSWNRLCDLSFCAECLDNCFLPLVGFPVLFVSAVIIRDKHNARSTQKTRIASTN